MSNSQPLRALASARIRTISSATSAQRTGHEDLVRCAEVGTPPDVDARRVDLRERLPSVEHHDELAHAVGPAFGQSPPGGHEHRLADPVQRDGERGGERLGRGDAGDDRDVEVDGAALGHLVEDPQRAVVQRRVAPDEERGGPARAHLRLQRGLEALDAGPVPGRHVTRVRRTAEVALGIRDRHQPVRVLDEAVEDRPAQVHHLGGGGALVDDEEHVGPLHRRRRLHGHVVGVADTDADHQHRRRHGSHRAIVRHAPHPAPLAARRVAPPS